MKTGLTINWVKKFTICQNWVFTDEILSFLRFSWAFSQEIFKDFFHWLSTLAWLSPPSKLPLRFLSIIILLIEASMKGKCNMEFFSKCFIWRLILLPKAKKHDKIWDKKHGKMWSINSCYLVLHWVSSFPNFSQKTIWSHIFFLNSSPTSSVHHSWACFSTRAC